jgi:hypothetical protein
MQQFPKFTSITRRLCTAQHVSGVPTPIIRSSTTEVAVLLFVVGPVGPTTNNNTATTTLKR